MEIYQQTSVKNNDETELSFNETGVRYDNQTVFHSYCFFEPSFARKAAGVASLVTMLLVLFAVSCLYARILRILIIKLKISQERIHRPRTNVRHLTATQQMELGIESQAQRHDTNIVNEKNDSDANVKFGDVHN